MPKMPMRGKGDVRSAPPTKGIFRRLMKSLFHCYPKMLTIALICIVFNAVVSALPSIFMKNIFTVIGEVVGVENGVVAEGAVSAAEAWSSCAAEITKWMCILIGLYVLSLASGAVNKQLLAVITQGYLKKMRGQMFDGMQDLPLRYFDTHNHGDVMSYYTNDIDTLRQMISESLPQLLTSGIMVVTLLAIMFYYSIWLTLIMIGGIILVFFITKIVGGGAGKYFLGQQRAMAKHEGYIEEMMNGQKVVKVFCHEEEAKRDFDKINEHLYDQSMRANRYANMLMPILGNLGHVLYVLIAVVGALFILNGVSNVGISTAFNDADKVFTIALLVAFLQTARQFSNNINQVSNQVNSVVMGFAGAARIFQLIDEKPEADEGYVTLVNAREDENGNLTECEERTGLWAWRHPHKADGTVTYTKLTGDIVMQEVDFGYTEEKIVLHDISLYAKPGQKVAFVGATGAGKTTITNLLTRFYDIADGKIRYDGINVNKIKKGELRRAIGMVLQDTNLFTGTVMENIRYGKLDATDEECVAAAKLAGADDFIRRLPDGYNTELHQNGANLSQGQRQLLSIARAAVADPPVMILDEATSSIDTRTEAIVQRGMDKLMEGRTVFVIAHRLSTVKNSNAIMVLDHGRIIERGTHEQLIAAKGQYYQLYTGAFELE